MVCDGIPALYGVKRAPLQTQQIFVFFAFFVFYFMHWKFGVKGLSLLAELSTEHHLLLRLFILCRELFTVVICRLAKGFSS